MPKHSKRFNNAHGQVDRNKRYELDEAMKLLQNLSKAKFDETVELHIALGVDPKKSDQMVRGSLSLPNGIGQSRKVIVFAEGDDATKAKEAGAIEAGGEELAEKIQGGWLDFDIAIAAPYTMKYVGKLGRVLGPQGKMPSPKAGTVTEDVETAVKEFVAGKIEFRVDAGGSVHVPVGKRSFDEQKLAENIEAFLDHLRAIRPTSAKGRYMKTVTVTSTMGPGIGLVVE